MNHKSFFPQNSQLYVALGAALSSMDEKVLDFSELMSRFDTIKLIEVEESNRLQPLFQTREDYDLFKARHQLSSVSRGKLKGYKGNCFFRNRRKVQQQQKLRSLMKRDSCCSHIMEVIKEAHFNQVFQY